MYRRVTCYHYMGVWSYNSWIRSYWIHWKGRYIPIRNRGNSEGPEHCLWRTGAWASYCLWRTWPSWRKWIPGNECLLHRFQGLCMTHTTLYIQKNAYDIQIFTLCNCIMYISNLTYRQRVTHKLVKDGPERNTVTDLNDCLWRTLRHWTELRPGGYDCKLSRPVVKSLYLSWPCHMNIFVLFVLQLLNSAYSVLTIHHYSGIQLICWDTYTSTRVHLTWRPLT